MSLKAERSHGDKKRVLLVVRWPVGGIRTFIRYVYRNFDPLEWHFTIIAPDLDEMRILVNDLSNQNMDYIPVCGIPNDGSSGIWRMFYCVSLLLIENKYDLIHSHGFTSGMCSVVPSLLLGIPHLMTSHDVFNENQFNGISGNFKRFGMQCLFTMIDKIHSVSHDAKDNFITYFPSLSGDMKNIVVKNGIEIDRFLDAEPRDLRAELNLGSNTFLIGFMGRFMTQKGFRYLIDAMELLNQKEKLPKRPIVLTFGQGGFVREEIKSIKERGLENMFLFMPFTSNIASTIKGIDVIVMPSLWEACPLLPMETLVCGKPIIGSNCIGLREVLKNTPALMVQAGNEQELTEALRVLIINEMNEVFDLFVDEAVKRFDVKNQSREMMVLYDKMIHN